VAAIRRALAAFLGAGAPWLALVDTEEGLPASAEAVARLTLAANGVVALPSVGVPLPKTLDQLQDLAAAAEKANRPAVPVVLVGRAPLELTAEQRNGLRAYLAAGGFLIVLSADAGFSTTVLDTLAQAVPGLQAGTGLAAVSTDPSLPYRCEGAQARNLTFEGRLVGVVLGREYLEAWGTAPTAGTSAAYEFGANVLAYALQGAYRAAVAKANG